jgi:outer membrane protein assembly factor BamB
MLKNLTVLLGIVLVACVAHSDSSADNWASWRGPTYNGVALTGNPPTTWSETENIKWKIELPGTGSSTPVVWGDKMFFQTAVAFGEPVVAAKPEQKVEPVEEKPTRRRRGSQPSTAPTQSYKFNLVCLDRNTGNILWERTTTEAIPHEGHHPTANFAPYSPVTDGEHVWASFGSRGLYCYDLDGNLKWSADLIKMSKRMKFGEGSSPALAGDAIIVLLDHEGDSKITAFDKDSGKILWEADRRERTNWTTPVPVQVGDTLEVVTSATNSVRSYNAKTGELIWETKGQTLNTIPSPLIGFGNVYCTSGFRGHSLQAITLGNSGVLTDTDAIAWEVDHGTPYVASPVLYDDKIYLLADLKAILSCYDANTGKPLFADQRLSGLKQIYASPVGAGGHVYIPDREGTTMVIKHSGEFEVVATNVLDDGFDASPVVIGDTLYLKGNRYLYCIEKS